MLEWEVFLDLWKRWPVIIDLFTTSSNHQCSPYFSPFHNPNALGTDTLLQNWDVYQVYALPPWSLIPLVLKKLCSSSGVLMTPIAPLWPQRPWYPELLDLVVDGPVPLPLPRDLLGQPHFHRHHLGISRLSFHAWRLQRFARSQGFSSCVARQIAFARRPSSRAGYQAKWSVFRHWCRLEGHSVSGPTLPKVADFLFWLRRSRKLSVSAILGYRSMLVVVFKLPNISTSPVSHDLVCSFKVEVPVRPVRPPPWDLEVVLRFLRSSTFEPLSSLSLCALTKKVLFLASLATAKRVGELQALSVLFCFLLQVPV